VRLYNPLAKAATFAGLLLPEATYRTRRIAFNLRPMMTRLLCLAACFLAFSQLSAQDKPAYALYNAKGKATSYAQMLKAMQGADVVLFGELHDNPIVHWLQYESTKALIRSRNGQVVLGAEMFEADVQAQLNRFLAKDTGLSEKDMMKICRAWPNYKTDYKPLVELAQENKLPFIATNIARRYASVVYRGGFEALDTLPEAMKQTIAPLPVSYDSTLPGYRDIFMAVGGHGTPNLPKAQAIKDATMGWFIAQHSQPGSLFIHYNGTYHSDNREGILWYLNRYKPGLKVVTISSRLQDQATPLQADNKGKADFTIIVPESMTRTY
jgi:uncharacterized iron-regulated protein